MPTGLLAYAALLLLPLTADAAVLCAKPKPDGTLSSTVKVREACKPAEVQLDPTTLGFPASDALRLVRVVTQPVSSLFTTSATFQDIPDTMVEFESRAPCVLAQFSALARGDSGNVIVRALLDAVEMDPGTVRYDAIYPGLGAFTFVRCGVPTGPHSLVMQFHSADEGAEAVVSERGLVVTEGTLAP